MSETPKTPAGQLTDRIMMMIHEHIRPSRAPAMSGGDQDIEHHYNRAWEKVHAILEGVQFEKIGRGPWTPVVGTKQCGKLVCRAGSIKRCTLLANHEGKCVT